MSTFSGVWGEIYAARYLRDNGYRICGSNYRTRFGELDIIAEKDGVLVFVEVKTRSDGMLARPMEAVDRQKQRKLSLAAKQFFRHESPQMPARFDVIEVYLDACQKPSQICHIPDAFDSMI